eukprot:PhM_4_TR16072/c0_g1_i1/m.94376
MPKFTREQVINISRKFKAFSGMKLNRATIAFFRACFNAGGIAPCDTKSVSIVKQKGTFPGRWYTPKKLQPQGQDTATILYFHGGAMFSGSSYSHRPMLVPMCRETSCRIFAVDYPLAPEHPFPAAVEDCYRHYCHLVSS